MPLTFNNVLKRTFVSGFLLCSLKSFSQVTLPTGALQSNFSLYSYSDDVNRISTSIALDYVLGSGLKVNEFIGCAGLGWNMQMGGVIMRNQVGEPDDQKFKNMPANHRDAMITNGEARYAFPDGYIHAPYDPAGNPPKVSAYIPIMGDVLNAGYSMNLDDREQDLFTFQFGTKTGQFVIGKNKEVKVLQDGNLKIRFNEADMFDQKIRTTITSFIITDEGGIEYTFGARELTDVFTYKQTQRPRPAHSIVDAFEVWGGLPFKVATKWFLTEIKNPMTGKKIQFNYESYNMDIIGKLITVSQQSADDGGTARFGVQALNQRNRFQTYRLKSIVMPEKYSAEIDYGIARKDLQGERALTKISIKYDGKILYGYEFAYKYLLLNDPVDLNFNFNPNQDWRLVRLILTGFSKFGENGVTFPAHEFTYDLPTIAENGTSAYLGPTTSMMSDHWGYPALVSTIEDQVGGPYTHFTGQDKVVTFAFDPLKPKWGMLKTIKYPEGGSLTYSFEPNVSESSPYLSKYAGGFRVASTTLYDGVDHLNDIVSLYKYVKEDGTSSSWGFEMPRYSESRTLRVYQKQNRTFVSNYKDMASKYVMSVFTAAPTSLSAGGGSLGAMMSAGSSGGGAIASLAISYAIDLLTLIFSPNFKEYPLTITYNDNINLQNPLPFMYSRVEVIEKKGQDGANLITNGKTVYTFTSNQEFPLRIGTPMLLPFSIGKKRYASWLYGHPLTITVFNKDNQPVKKTINEYDGFTDEIPGNNFISKAYAPNNILIGDDGNAYARTEDQFLSVDAYQPIHGRIQLKSSTEILYNSNGGSTQSVTNYTYNPINYNVRSFSTTNSKGETIGSTTYYNCDYDIPGPLNEMKNRNILNVPVSITNWKKSSTDNQRKMITSNVIEYGQLDNGDFRPVKSWKSRTRLPLDNTIAEESNFSGSNLWNYSYLRPSVAQLYKNGQLVEEVALEGGDHNCHIYDYDNKLIVATTTNASFNEVRYTSFEAEGNGGWNFQSDNIVDVVSPTGRRSYDLAKGNVTTTVKMASRPVIVSFWSNGGQVILNIGGNHTPLKTGELINGWRYYEYEIASVSSTDQITISGNGLLDEVRLYPKGAQMATTTYKQGIGKESECDLNGRILYYEYDALGRIFKIKDQYLNLVKLFEYNYKQ